MSTDIIDNIDALTAESCHCVCGVCLSGDHCDTATCAIPDDECTCSMTESSMRRCPEHGEDDIHRSGRVGEFEIAYLQGAYERCPHCDRHWHGLPLTAWVAEMYNRGQYDPDYTTTDDTSTVLCEGSTFIGPRRPTYWELINAAAAAGSSVVIWHGLPANAIVQVSMRRGDGTVIWSGTAQPRHARGHHAALFAMDEMLSHWLQPSDAWWREHCTAPTTVEFGPQHWHHEIDAPRRRAGQFPRQFPGLFVTPVEYDVNDKWQQFTQQEHQPTRPGYDWTKIEQRLAAPTSGPERPSRRERYHHTGIHHQPATAPRRQRGRRRA